MIKQLPRGLIMLSIMLAQLAIAKPQALDSIVAVVNDTVITQSEVDKALRAVKSQMTSANVPVPAADALHHQVIEELIDRKLQLQTAEQAGIKISDAEVDQTIDNIARNNGMSSADLYQKINSQGLSKTEYRKEISEEIKLQRIEQQEVAAKISLSADEIKNAAQTATPSVAAATTKEYQLEDLIVLLPEAASATQIAAAKNQANALLVKARSGMSYQALAAAETNHHSVEKADLGWRSLAEVPSAFANQVGMMKKNSVLEPIQTANGFHLLHLTDVRTQTNQAAATPAPTAKQAEQWAYERKLDVAIKKWVAKLRSQAVINMHPNN